jgi:hypothetical protein
MRKILLLSLLATLILPSAVDAAQGKGKGKGKGQEQSQGQGQGAGGLALGKFAKMKGKFDSFTDTQKTCLKEHKGECRTKCGIPELNDTQKSCVATCRAEYQAKGEKPKGACAEKCGITRKNDEDKGCLKACRTGLAKTCGIDLNSLEKAEPVETEEAQ